MRYALTEGEWQIIQPTLPRRSRGVPRVDDRRILNGIFWWPRADKSDLSRARSDEPTPSSCITPALAGLPTRAGPASIF